MPSGGTNVKQVLLNYLETIICYGSQKTNHDLNL